MLCLSLPPPRELLLNSVAVPALAAILGIGAAPRPSNLGLKDYGNFKSLGLCPPTPNCISTAEEVSSGRRRRHAAFLVTFSLASTPLTLIMLFPILVS
jgi:uncharacterized protein (DUF1499 family)